MKKNYITDTPGKTRKLGKNLAEVIIGSQKSFKKAKVLGLKGDLGGGKTTFLQGFARGLGVSKKILSPTFVIMKRYPLKKDKNLFKNFYHLDCYRVKNSKEILNLGFQKIIFNSQNIVAVEWAEKIKKQFPKKIFWIEFQFINDKKRKITITS
ncbi:tRNA (adenosine(37)-N6)-threonylcarbamoyltransferase complex ATPase subunit type 1 TsaE [Patescibacteria group bacterium]